MTALTKGPIYTSTVRCAKQYGSDRESEELSRDISTWTRALELQLLSTREDIHESERFKYRGRAGPVILRKMPLMRENRITREPLPIPGGMGAIARLWTTCSMMIRKLKRSYETGSSLEAVLLGKMEIMALVTSKRREAWKIWNESVDKAARTSAIMALFWAVSTDTTTARMDTAAKMFERLAAEEIRRAKQIAQEQWEKWVRKTVLNGAGAAHKWCNRPNRRVVDLSMDGIKHPAEVAAEQRATWGTLWDSEDEEKIEQGFAALRNARDEALKQDGSIGAILITPARIRQVCREFKATTSVGLDHTRFKEIAQASDEALEELCCILQRIVRNLV